MNKLSMLKLLPVAAAALVAMSSCYVTDPGPSPTPTPTAPVASEPAKDQPTSPPETGAPTTDAPQTEAPETTASETSNPTTDQTEGGSAKGAITYDAAQQAIEAAMIAGHKQQSMSFTTADGSVFCVVKSDSGEGLPGVCELTGGVQVKDQACAESAANGGAHGVGRIEVDGDSRMFVKVCNSDTMIPTDKPGDTLKVGWVAYTDDSDYACLNTGAGVTCIDSEREQAFLLGPQVAALSTE